MADAENKHVSVFELICRTKDTQPSNLNKLFASYGCQTLEARIPIVKSGVANLVKNELNPSTQRQCTLALKSESANNAVEGRIPRTRNRQLTLVEIGDRDTVIAAGQERDRSPVDRGELDDELEEYMRKTAEATAKRAHMNELKKKAREERHRAFKLPEISNLQIEEPNWDE